MKSIMIAATESGSGKTIFTCGLIRALIKKGHKVSPFKCGPDYIDPMYLKTAANSPCRNLDLFLQGQECAIETFENSLEDGLAVIEGAMGYYDGVNGTDEASAYQVAETLDVPVILLVKPQKNLLTLAAQIKGMLLFRMSMGLKKYPGTSMIAGVVINECSEKLYKKLSPVIEEACKIPVLGYMPHLSDARIDSRHLGLILPEENDDIIKRIDTVAAMIEKNIDLDMLLEISSKKSRKDMFMAAAEKLLLDDDVPDPDPVAEEKKDPVTEWKNDPAVDEKVTIAVAHDEAFMFYYEDSMDALKRAGAKIVYFSPLRDKALPECDGLYIGGGYPELFSKELSDNISMKADIKAKIDAGLAVVAECGGFMYLSSSIKNEDNSEDEMVGLFDGKAYKTDQAQRFGYLYFTAQNDSMLFLKGEKIPAHEYHHYNLSDCGKALSAQKPDGLRWKFGFVSKTMYAGFPHLHFGGELPLAERFVEAALEYSKRK